MRLIAVASRTLFEADFGKAFVAGAAGVAGLDGLGDGAFDAGAGGVALAPGFGVLLAAAVLQGFVLLAGVQGQAAETGAGAVGFDRAGLAADVVEVDVDPGMSVNLSVDPAGAGFALWAGRGVGVPVDGEVAQGVAAVLAILPSAGDGDRADQIDAQVRGLNDEFGAHVAGVDQVLGRSPADGGQVLLDRQCQRGVIDRRGGGGDVCVQVRGGSVGICGFASGAACSRPSVSSV
jgi:hypothetical protein